MSHKEKIEGEIMEKENQKPGYELPETFVGVNSEYYYSYQIRWSA